MPMDSDLLPRARSFVGDLGGCEDEGCGAGPQGLTRLDLSDPLVRRGAGRLRPCPEVCCCFCRPRAEMRGAGGEGQAPSTQQNQGLGVLWPQPRLGECDSEGSRA